jgi:hypothetical protein
MSTFYMAAWTDSELLLGCDHMHTTIASAVACGTLAGSYVIAVEVRKLRQLNAREERQFQALRYGNSGSSKMAYFFVPYILSKITMN